MAVVFYWRQSQQPEPGRYGVEWGLTDRHDGVSRVPYASLNLGAGVGDDPSAVRQNRALVAHSLALEPASLRFMQQQHGCDVHIASAEDSNPALGDEPLVDGLIVQGSGRGVAALVADCTPVLIVDRSAGYAAAVHAGRPGMMREVVPAVINRLVALGASDLEAVVGPSICGRCYEVPRGMREEAGRISSVAPTMSWSGTPSIDVAAGVVDQLSRLEAPTLWLPGCARESDDLFSYRGEGKTGRFAAVVRLTDPTGGH